MSELKLCQGTKCHTYNTKDRLKGMKDNKTFQTRRRSNLYYGSGNFVHCIAIMIGQKNLLTEQLTTSED